MKEIPLTRGYVALVDDEDFERIAAMGKWWAHVRTLKDGSTIAYGRRNTSRKLGKRAIFMHVEVAGYTRPDHVDGNGLNNRRGNLRPATRAQNNSNVRKRTVGCTSRYKGVCWNAASGKWKARICGKNLGHFTEEFDAAQAYNLAAAMEFGEFAVFNTPLRS